VTGGWKDFYVLHPQRLRLAGHPLGRPLHIGLPLGSVEMDGIDEDDQLVQEPFPVLVRIQGCVTRLSFKGS
jgi:hypothetical protein